MMALKYASTALGLALLVAARITAVPASAGEAVVIDDAALRSAKLEFRKEVARFLKRVNWQPKTHRDWDRIARIGAPALELIRESLKTADAESLRSAVDAILKIGKADQRASGEAETLLTEVRDHSRASALVITKAAEALSEIRQAVAAAATPKPVVTDPTPKPVVDDPTAAIKELTQKARTARADQLEGIAKSIGDLAQKYPKDADKAREAVVKALSNRAVDLAGKATPPELGTVAALVTQIQSQFKDIQGAAQVGKEVVKVLSGRAMALAKTATPAELGELATLVENVLRQFPGVEGTADVPKGVVKELSDRAIHLAGKATSRDLDGVAAFVEHIRTQYKGVAGTGDVPKSVVKALSDKAADLAQKVETTEEFGALRAFVAEVRTRFQGVDGAAEVRRRVADVLLPRAAGEKP